MLIYIEKLTRSHAKALFHFEVANRSFFETMVPSRGESYYEWNVFLKKLDSLLKEQKEKEAYYYLIMEKAGTIVGRINIVLDTTASTGDLGYRIGQDYTRKGLAKRAVETLLKEKHVAELERITAKTTSSHIASQKVLERNGFIYVKTDPVAFYFRGNKENFVHYELVKGERLK
ncbi:acetyltransferase [Pontibacillus chungwhensis BH030062]|uniref:Acetyltransferase n=1 Tax=Pontibacillus chungwhensis BH030062 TaxID=1385513 RepID=A0A0A2VDP8_9BACI|nr:GNAT family N-acetyltransferase [Pontibacillus chungwhensis]KGP91790.1 acetyltransferase [Pontibacillus chungwhensis BH030062]